MRIQDIYREADENCECSLYYVMMNNALAAARIRSREFPKFEDFRSYIEAYADAFIVDGGTVNVGVYISDLIAVYDELMPS